jgi:hypothetical protein
MQVKLALLADAANVSREGKLNLLGNFDTIYARSFPTAHAHMQLVLRLEAGADEAGSVHAVEVQLLAPDDTVLVRLPATLTVHRQEAGETIRIDHILTLTNVAFARPGRYAFRIVLDGGTATTVPLRVEQIPVAH